MKASSAFRHIHKLIDEALDQQDGGLVSTEHFARILMVCDAQAEAAEQGLFDPEGEPDAHDTPPLAP